MRNHKFAVPPFLLPVIQGTYTEQPDWPIQNVLLDTFPRQPWRSLTTGQQDLILDFGSAVTLSAILIRRTNYPRVILSYADTVGGTYTDITPAGYDNSGGLLLPVNDYSQRRQLIVDLGNITHRYLRLRIPGSQTTDDGATYYSSGAITITSNLQQIPLSYAELPDWQVPEPATIKEYPSGAKSVNLLGDKRAIISISGQFVTAKQKAAFVALHAAGPRPIILYPFMAVAGSTPDSFDPSDAWLMRRTSTTDFKFSTGVMDVFGQEIQYEEVV